MSVRVMLAHMAEACPMVSHSFSPAGGSADSLSNSEILRIIIVSYLIVIEKKTKGGFELVADKLLPFHVFRSSIRAASSVRLTGRTRTPIPSPTIP